MTPEQIQKIQDSFTTIKAEPMLAADIFYDSLFDNGPEIRDMFPIDTSEQKKKLMKTLGVITQSLSRPEVLKPVLEELGRAHKDYGVVPAHFDLVRDALMHMLDERLDMDFTPETRAAWLEVYADISSIMMKAMH